MPHIITVRGESPQLGDNCFVAPNATLIGKLKCGDDCSFWFNAVVRADVHYIKMGRRVNVQDGAVIHCTYKKFPTTIGNNVSIGHNALVHGCTVEDNVLIGMGAIVMDNVHIHKNVIIGAGAVVTQNTVCESWSVYAGNPAKKIKTLSPELFAGEVQRIAKNYVKYASWFKE